MITSFFTSTRRDGSTSSQSSSSAAVEAEPPPKKKQKKRNDTDGFSKHTTTDRIEAMKEKPEGGHWRTFGKIDVAHTIIYKDWSYDNESYRELILAPFGMVEALVKLHSSKKNICDWRSLKYNVKVGLKLDEITYDVNKLKVNAGHMGNLGVKQFQHILCSICTETVFPFVVNKYKSKLPDNCSVADLMCNWDLAKIQPKYSDVVGCLLPNEEHVHCGPNSRRFIVRPTEHSLHDKHQIATKNSASATPVSTAVGPPAPSLDPGQLVLANSCGKVTTKRHSIDDVVTIRGKTDHKLLHLVPIETLLDPHVNLTSKVTKPVDIWAKQYVLKHVHTGVKKLISNEASIEFYGTVIDCVREYHTVVLKDVEICKKKVPPPPRVLLDYNNIHVPQRALLASFKQSTDVGNPYCTLRSKSGDWYSIMHDGIQKFRKELNGVHIRTLSADIEVVNVPWMLTEIPGGSLNNEKLIHQLFNVMKSVRPIPESADQKVSSILLQTLEATDFPKPPKYFEVCELLHFDVES